MYSIFIRIIKQIKNDKRSIVLLIFAPLLVLTLLYFILGDSNYKPKIGIYQMNDTFASQLKEKAKVIIYSDRSKSKEDLINEKVDAFLWNDSKGIHITFERKNSKSASALKAIQDTNKVFLPEQNNMIVSYIYHTADDNQLNSLSFVFLGVLSFFFVFILSGMSFVRERFSQTLERMLMTPISRFEVIGGYTLGFGVLSAIQSIIIILYSVYILNIQVKGSIFLCMLVMILMSFLAVSLGALFSIFSNNELQLVQFIPVVLVPQIFYSGLIPLDTIPFGLGKLCFIIPIYYASAALDKIMIEGKGMIEILPYITGLVLYITILFFINVISLKKYRRL